MHGGTLGGLKIPVSYKQVYDEAGSELKLIPVGQSSRQFQRSSSPEQL